MRWRSTAFHHAPGFWDLLVANGITLSLNRRTLQELDRRNSLENQRTNLLEERPSKVIGAQIAQAVLKRFARLGGPNLSKYQRGMSGLQSILYQGAKTVIVPRTRVYGCYGQPKWEN